MPCTGLLFSARPRNACGTGLIDRRSIVDRALLTSALAAGAVSPMPASASGGATAGKTTSIPRAKTRYYGRINAAVASFKELGLGISAAADSKAVKAAGLPFFSESDPNAGAGEIKGAGYLLSVAFKIDSKIPPDKIQQVKVR